MSDLSTILPPSGPDRSWTLFIDRDGVINQKRDNDYVKHWGEFIFIPGAIEALSVLSQRFGRMIIVTNQRGIGRGLMSEEDLADIHQKMSSDLETGGVVIDRIYHAPDLAENDTRGWRKPKDGMARQAVLDFPEIDLTKSIVIGDSLTDMMFGRNAGMYTSWVADPSAELATPELVDLRVTGLEGFADWLNRYPLPSSTL